MKTMGPDGRLIGQQPTRTAVRATPPLPERPDERPGDVTTIWRDGDVIRQSPNGRMRVLPSVNPISEREAVQ